MSERLAQLLDGSLSPTPALRADCEAQLTGLLYTPGFALQLCEFLFAPTQEVSSAHKQLACLLLKKLVNSYWVAGGAADDDGDSDSNGAPAPGNGYVVHDEEKRQVKHAIVAAIQQRLELFAESKLQTALCLTVTAIFERDWPDQWSEILPVVLQLIAGTDKLRIEFAIRFLSLAGGHFSSDSCCDLVALVFPHLQRVYVAADEFPAGMRARIVRIVQSNLLMVGMEAQVGNDSARQLLHANVSEWIALFVAQLAAPVTVVKDYSIKIQVLATLTSFVKEWPKDMADVLPQVLPQVHALLLRGIDAFERDVVLNAGEEADGYDSDSEGGLVGHSAMVVAAFEFLRGTVHAPTKRTRALVLAGLRDFVFVMLAYMQITAHQMGVWADDPNKYVADEDDDSLAYNVRNAATDLLTELESVLGRKAVVAALDAAQQRLQAGANSSWRLQEAALLVVGTLAVPTLAALNKRAAEVVQLLDLPAFLQTLFQVMTTTSEPIYLRARALWCASRLAPGMGTDMLAAFLQVALAGLEQTQELPVRMYACRAVGAIVKQDAARAHVQAVRDVMLARLIQLAQLATDETLHIALETLVVVLQDAEALGVDSAVAVIDCFLHHWRANLNDPLVGELMDGALGALLELDDLAIVAAVHDRVLPMLRAMLEQSCLDLAAAGNGVNTAGSALTILKTLLRHSFVLSTNAPDGGATDRQMGAQVIALVFEPLIAVLGAVEDEKVLNAGAECLKWLVMCAIEPLAAYTCANGGGSGVDATMAVAAKLLAPTLHDSCAICVGGLITQLLLKLGAALPPATVQSILTAVSARLATAALPSLVQSLCLVFARLVHSHGRALLDVLEQLPPPAGSAAPSMLVFVFATWIERQQDFYGLYCIKVTTTALLEVAAWNDPRVNQITVAGSEADATAGSVSGASGIQTRSRAKNAPAHKQLVTVHFPTKLFVVVARTLAQLSDDEDEWESSDDEDDEFSDDDGGDDAPAAVAGGASSSIFAPSENYELLSDRLDDAAGAANDFGDAEDEFEAHFDPLNEVDLKERIPQTLQLLTANSELLQAVLPELTNADKELLASVSALSA